MWTVQVQEAHLEQKCQEFLAAYTLSTTRQVEMLQMYSESFYDRTADRQAAITSDNIKLQLHQVTSSCNYIITDTTQDPHNT